ncbi:hypothetical protein NQ317_011746 [Molorchus minor]|uniref:HTH psq-type domain-containing protein n=1 Tax=Molorchus minor TaxID=1323400 RepID=A0ABQ9JTR5_9CUCU|nr:hypothetical protein NQ317_011746 [Molorchus minor]
MPRRTEQDKDLRLSQLEEGWFIRRVATHHGVDKSTVLRVKRGGNKKEPPANAEELWKVIQNAWEELREDQNYSQNLQDKEWGHDKLP